MRFKVWIAHLNNYPSVRLYANVAARGKMRESVQDARGDHVVNRKYPVWDTDTEKLIAFLFGIISHQVRHPLKCVGKNFNKKGKHFFKIWISANRYLFQVADISFHSLQVRLSL